MPTADEQLLFLQNIQKLLTEGQFVSSYKYALLHALTDLAVLKGDDSGAPLQLSIREIVEQMAELYWSHAVPYAGIGTLKQSPFDEPTLLKQLAQARLTRLDSLLVLKASGPRWEALLEKSIPTVSREPIRKLQRLGDRENRFLFERRSRGHLTLEPGVAYCLRAFRGLLTELIQGSWLRFVRRRNTALDSGQPDLSQFLFGSSRKSLAEIKPRLLETQKGLCFFCGRDAGNGVVDHFIPWSRFPNNLIFNLVVADTTCNGAKSDLLAAERHLRKWVQRLETDTASALVPDALAPPRDAIDRSHRIARWAYSAAAAGDSQVWLGRGSLEKLGGEWRTLLAETRQTPV